MRIQRIDSSHERQILTALLVDSTVLGRIASKWQGNMFRTSYANLVANWAIEYFNKYQKAPMKHIEGIFETWAEQSKDKNTINLIEKFLSGLSDDYKELKKGSNSDYLIDLSGTYFNQVCLEKLIETMQGDLDVGKIDKAKNRVFGFNQIELGLGEGINVIQDKEAIREAFAEEIEPMFKYRGALGRFFGNSLERDGFLSFLGPEKRGKTFWLLDIAFRAMVQRKRVAFFGAGDMSQNQIMRRLLVRVAQRPAIAKEIKYPKVIFKDSDDEQATVRFENRLFTKNLSWQKAYKACKVLMKKKIKSKEPLLKLSSHPNSTLKVRDIHNILKGWEREGWVPDVIVIDYADILNMDYPHIEGRERINETWKQLRALSQIYHCLVFTATQSDADSYDAIIMNKSNFSDDKRKIAHVTGMIGLNQTPGEKDYEIMRLNWIVRREEEFHEKRCVYVAGCLSIGNPAIKSCFEKK
jgi:hypothetical protein